MYYKEEVVDGVLCWKNSPDGEWKQFSSKELTKQLIDLKRSLSLSNLQIEEFEGSFVE